MKKISFILGTRPEGIKLCPLILELKNQQNLVTHICVTGQHREMLDQVLDVFGVIPDVDLSIMQHNQTLSDLTARAITAIDGYLSKHKPDLVIIQGDTTTVFCAALSAFYNQIPIGHVEAGLRTWNKFSPFPEEINRVLTTRLAQLHFAPTITSRDNLIKEGIHPGKIYVTGNTVIDALHLAVEKLKEMPQLLIPGIPAETINCTDPIVLITGHRRENFGEGFKNICQAIVSLAQRFPSTSFIYPVHLNPNVRRPVISLLGNVENIHLIEPLSYLPFISLMTRATIILTDSGGIQEEAPSLGKPVLVMRDNTERPEAVEMGTVKMVGTNKDKIIEGVSMLLTDEKAYKKMANSVNPYGDGKAAHRILEACKHFLDED